MGAAAPPQGRSARLGFEPLRYPFFSCRFRNRTPGPPPFSSMNSTPADLDEGATHVAPQLSSGLPLLC